MLRTILAAAGFALAAAGGASAQDALKLAFFAGANDSTYSGVVAPWIDDVNRTLAGKLRIDGFPGGALGRNPAVQVKLVQDGVADLAFFVPSYTPGRFPDNEVMELPGVIRNSRESSIALWRIYAKGLLRGYDEFHVIMLVTTFPYNIHTTFPVTEIADLKGKKLRAGGPVAADTIKALGAVPVGMPIPAVAENISKGVLDGSAADWNVMYAFRIVDVTKHHYMAHMGTVPIGILFNKRRWDGLPAGARAAIDALSGEALARRFARVNGEVQEEYLQRTRKTSGHSFVFPDAQATAAWDRTMNPVIDAWVAKHPKGKALLDALKKELAAVRAES